LTVVKKGPNHLKIISGIFEKEAISVTKLPNKAGGGGRTNELGLHFEQTTDLKELFQHHPDFEIRNDFHIYKNGQYIGLLLGKHSLYKNYLEPKGIDYTKIISKKLLPDDAILVGKTLYILEKKFQSGPGSVDEKLQTCDFKKKQYTKLLTPLNIRLQYYYIFNDWFRKPEYEDVRNYIVEVGCKYFFNEIPLHELGL
jgi:hypothetical protein